MQFRHKDIRLPLDRYRGKEWFFVTFCCEERRRVFLAPSRAQWLLDNLRAQAAQHSISIHAYCIMPDHVHLLSEGLTPTSHLLRFLKDLKQQTGFTHKQEPETRSGRKNLMTMLCVAAIPPILFRGTSG